MLNVPYKLEVSHLLIQKLLMKQNHSYWRMDSNALRRVELMDMKVRTIQINALETLQYLKHVVDTNMVTLTCGVVLNGFQTFGKMVIGLVTVQRLGLRSSVTLALEKNSTEHLFF